MKAYFLWVAKLITLIVVILVVVPMALISLVAAAQAIVADKTGDPKKLVAVVELNGVIENSKDVLNELYKQVKNENVKGIVLSINSPGGSVGPSQEIYGAVRRWRERKPIVAVMGSVAASGGLYAALGASKVLAQPGTMTGSIGVIMQIPNVEKIANWAGLEMVTVKSGELKDVGNSFRPMTDAERAFLDTTVSDVHGDFIQAVVEGRNIPKEQVLKWADGRVILGSQAKEFRLIDDYGDVYDGGRAVFELLGEPLKDGEDPMLFYPENPWDEFRKAVRTVSTLPAMLRGQTELLYLMR